MPRASYRVYHDDSLELMPTMKAEFDAVICDPPYHLSGGGTTCRSGQRASVDKGKWDKPLDFEAQVNDAQEWLAAAKTLIPKAGSLMICANKNSLGAVLGGLAWVEGLTVQNIIIWEKPAPPPNLGCRCFTHSHEAIVWATTGKGYYFAYQELKKLNGDKQMRDVWRFDRARGHETRHGRHPTQKPVALMQRLVQAVCPPGGAVLDPFCGAGSTGVAVKKLGEGRRFVGIEREEKWVKIARQYIREA